MEEQATKEVMDRYFNRMGAGEDFSDCYTSDVSWTTFDDGGHRALAQYGNISSLCTRTWLTREPGN
jgi:hypothetical protein